MRERVVVQVAAASAILSGVFVCGCTTPIALPRAPTFANPSIGQVETLGSYKLQIGDALDIKFPFNSELNESVTIAPDGTISTAYLQSINAYGATIPELATKLREGYRTVLTKPMLSVILRSFAPNRVYVNGEVNNPGEFITVGPNLTLTQAISRAGGVKFSADRTKVFIIRRTEKDKPRAYHVDYYGVITGRNPDGDIRLAQYDIVYVARTPIGDAYQAVNQYLLQFFPIGATLGATLVP